MPAESTSKVPIGAILADKYRVTKEIGRGGMAAVYEAENVDIGKRVAVKVLAAELITSRVVRERFLREARATAAVRSPYICDVYDVGEFEARPFLVMELLEGESLYDRMTHVRRLDVQLTVRIATQTARGLAKAHAAGIVHRDLKPENLFLTQNEEGEVLTKLLDFGLAKFYAPTGGTAAQARLTREGALFGTPAYMSPEQAKGRGEVDHRSDLWALGCIVYECLTGQTVWNVDQGVAMILAQVASAPIPLPSKLRPDLPSSFDTWFLRALERNPDQRFQTAGQLAFALSEALSPEQTSHLATPSLMADVDEILLRAPARMDSPLDPSNREPPSSRRQSPSPPSPLAAAAAAPPASAEQSAQSSTVPAPPSRSHWRRIALMLLVLGSLAGVWWLRGKLPWHHLWEPSTQSGTRGMVETPDADSSVPVESAKFAQSFSRAQMALAEGKLEHALGIVDEVIRTGGEGIGTNFRSHVRAALETPTTPCQLRGLGRPRPFDVADPASRPTLASSPRGVVVSWVDSHEERTRRQVFTTLLDSGLRRIAPARLAAPEPSNARYPQLTATRNHLVLSYWDGASKDTGIFVRLLDTQGQISGPTRRVAPVGRDEYSPAVARAEDGTFWIVWEDDGADGAEDLMARHLDVHLNPVGEAVRLTALVPDRITRPGAVKPSVVVTRGQMVILFTLRSGANRRVHRMQLPLNSPELVRGVNLPQDAKTEKLAVFAGQVTPIGQEGSVSDDARLACMQDACIALWGDESQGIVAGSLDLASGEFLWRHELAPRGSRPYVATTATEALAAWYDASRIRVAPVARQGVGTVSTLGKVSGLQPIPEIAPDVVPHQWLVAWRDYEAAHFEVVVARAVCQTPAY